jgi:adenylate kinase
MKNKIVLLGPPGCGKGTQSKLLVKNKDFFQLSTGDLLRQETNDKESVIGQEVKKIMEEGKLVPDEFVINIIVKKVFELKDNNIIFDGFPRNLNQANFLDKSLEEVSLNLDCAVLFDINFDVLEDRIKKRVEESGSNDLRPDDNLETLRNRIKIYKESTLPIVEYYKNKNILFKIDGMLSINDVYKNILKIIE